MFEHENDWKDRNKFMAENEKLRAEVQRLRVRADLAEEPSVERLEREYKRGFHVGLERAIEAIQALQAPESETIK